MKKISIKREQSQAGLSFAEREKFRPQVKNKLLLLLVLLLTAATGAWAQTYSVTLNDGTENPTTWTASTDGTNFGALPIGGLKGDGSETVTLKYNGRLKVKSVTATTDAAPAVNPNAYLKWDATKKELVETEIPAEVTMVQNNSDQYVEWAAGTYVVEGEVAINGDIILSGKVELIIKDGAKLTANRIDGGISKYDLSIYGQANQTGQLVVNSSDGDAIRDITTLEVHSAKVTATSSSGNCGGFYRIDEINVYGGSVDGEGTATDGYGILLTDDGKMNIFLWN